jgi:hypothetical protein
MRPDTYEAGRGHGLAYLEAMGKAWLPDALELVDGSTVSVEIQEPG